jgi:hypothetical protein
MQKIEYKYLVPNALLEALRNAFSPYLVWDKYSEIRKDKRYSVKSIYFDTHRLDFYQEKLSGLKRRKKLRIRGYNEWADDALVFLEIKRKNGQVISKNRAPLPYAKLTEAVLNNCIEDHIITDSQGDNLRDAASFLFYMRSMHLVPTIKITYEREAHFSRMNPNLRITLDSNLRSTLQVGFDRFFDDQNMIYALPGNSILEIKSIGGFPVWLQNLIARFDLKLQAISKYTNCMETHSNYEHRLQASLRGSRRFDAFKFKTKTTGR